MELSVWILQDLWTFSEACTAPNALSKGMHAYSSKQSDELFDSLSGWDLCARIGGRLYANPKKQEFGTL